MKNKKPAKILIVVESIDVENSSGSKANVALIRNLHNAGYDIKVYHYSRKEIQLDKIKCISIKERRRNLTFLISRIERYTRKYLGLNSNKYIENKFGFSFTLFNDRNSIVSELRRDNYNADLVLSLSQGGSFRPHHALLKMPEFHEKWMAYIHDPYPMHVFPPPYTYSEPGWKSKIEFVKAVFQRAKYFAFPSKLLMEWMHDHYHFDMEKAVVIPHQLNKSTNKPIDYPSFFQPSNFNLIHAGNLLWGRDPKGLIQGFQKFLKIYPEAKTHARLIFIGGKNHYSEYLKKVSSNTKEIEISEDYIAFEQVNTLQKQASVNIILEAKAEVSPFLPGKFPHCISANRPILLLGPSKSECRRLLGDDYPCWSEIDNIEKVFYIIVSLYTDWKENDLCVLNRSDLDYYLSENRLKEILDSILEKK
ncbi:UDP-glycosyltransferase [Christiangramia sp.]|uniref:UDP-glycosyltransferase n=1 Tax=Christiangramia sp. TaxID=1931228 RepID=UPI00263181DE|nr:UDP-glycosyltransferase [Christiangramia sp.]